MAFTKKIHDEDTEMAEAKADTLPPPPHPNAAAIAVIREELEA